ncbi:YheC/YheD family protein [Paenibacillus tarimensis]
MSGVIAMPYVGILVNDRTYRKIPMGNTKFEAIDHYVEAGKKYGISPCFIRLSDLKKGQSTVKAYVKQNGLYVRQHVPAPLVIHNRALYTSERQYRRLASRISDGRMLFNYRNRYGKLFIHRLLWRNPALRPHLPETCRATPANVVLMMKQYNHLIVKPNKSSIGRGVMRMDRTNTGWRLTYPVVSRLGRQKWRTIEWLGTRLPAILKNRIRKSFYIVQMCLPLAIYKGSPFDLRVSVQRTADGNWGITGIVAKVAPKHTFVTNVAQGGKTYRLGHILREEYPHLSEEDVVQRISDLSTQVAYHLSHWLPHMADLGLDVGITNEGYPMFIESNGKDQRYSFREAGMLDEWIATYHNPMAYAKYLLDASLNDGKSSSET